MTGTGLHIPTLETERLVLRAPREDDLPAVAAFAGSDRARFVGGPFTPAQAWGMLTASIGHWVLRGYGWWVIEDRATGRVAGRTGFGFPPHYPEPELGWHVYEGFEGKGIACEAARAARSRGARGFGITRPISLIPPDNLRSSRLAERLGAVPKGMVDIGVACRVWRHPDPEAAA